MGGAIHSRARTRGVVIRVPTRMINETFWGPRKFLFCWGPEDQGSRAGCIYRSLEGSGCRVPCLCAKPKQPRSGRFPNRALVSGTAGWAEVNTFRIRGSGFSPLVPGWGPHTSRDSSGERPARPSETKLRSQCLVPACRERHFGRLTPRPALSRQLSLRFPRTPSNPGAEFARWDPRGGFDLLWQLSCATIQSTVHCLVNHLSLWTAQDHHKAFNINKAQRTSPRAAVLSDTADSAGVALQPV